MSAKRKKIVLFGATGSIGQSTLEVISGNRDHLELVGIAADKDWQALVKIAQAFGVRYVALNNGAAARSARQSGLLDTRVGWLEGPDGLCALASLEEADIVVMAIPGTQGLQPTLAAIEAGKVIALASKEVLVTAGAFVMGAAQKHGVPIYPLDSEHNGAFQCLSLDKQSKPTRLILTASGGPFRDYTLEQMKQVKPADALCHPTWSMGAKISVDSATFANKGLELIEAHWLFGLAANQLDVAVHPQSIVHALVEHVDGSIFAQMTPPSMTFAIQHVLLYPERAAGVHPGLDFSQSLNLTFYPPDLDRFPCLGLARHCLEAGGCAPAVFNAANEVAVYAFIEGAIPFLAIAPLIEQTLEKVPTCEPSSLAELLESDTQTRAIARKQLIHYGF